MEKSADAFRTISEVADDLALPQHVLRFWETRFPQVRPLKRAGGRRYYRPNDILLLRTIRQLLYDDGYTIKGVQRLLKEQGAKGLATATRPGGGGAPVEFPTLHEADDLGAETVTAELMGAEPDAPSAGDVTTLTTADRFELEAALGTIEECQRILGALDAAERRKL